MTAITILTRRMIFDENRKKTSDIIYYWLSGEREDLMEVKK